MLTGVQRLVQQRTYTLLLGLIAAGFALLVVELIGYRHVEGAQMIGLAATMIGSIAALAGIWANAQLRRLLAGVFLVLALIGLFGTVQHNERLLGGENRPRAGQVGQGPQADGPGQPGDPAGPGDQGQPERAQGGPDGPGRRFRIPAPPLAPLSLSGFCLLGVVVLLSKKDDEQQAG